MNVPISVLVGKTVIKIEPEIPFSETKEEDYGDQLEFTCSDGTVYLMYHEQDCCESVAIEDINGDLNDLLNTPIILATVNSSNDDPNIDFGGIGDPEAYEWTFYRLATNKGYVNIRWYGTSNGYYSMRATFSDITKWKK